MVKVLACWLLNQREYCKEPAVFCLQTLQRSLGRQERRKLPLSIAEIQSVQCNALFVLRFALADGTMKSLRADSSTTLQEAVHTFLDKVSIPFEFHALFRPFYAAGTRAGQPTFKEITQCYAGEALYTIESQLEASRLSKDLSPRKLIPSDGERTQRMVIVMRQMYFINRLLPIQRPVLYNNLYHQLYGDFLKGTLICGLDDAIKLSSIHAQFTMSDQRKEQTYEPAEFIPNKLWKLLSPSEWQSQIQTQHLFHLGTSRDSAARTFVHHCQALSFWGSWICEATVVNSMDWPSLQQEVELQLLVSEDGIALYSLNLTQMLIRFDFHLLLQWKTKCEGTEGEYMEISIANYEHSLSVRPLNRSCSQLQEMLQGYWRVLLEHSPFAEALEDHRPDEPNSNNWDLLPFRKGDVIRVLSVNEGNGWEFGELNGVFGNYPMKLVNHTLFASPEQLSSRNLVSVDTG